MKKVLSLNFFHVEYDFETCELTLLINWWLDARKKKF